jgi:hypothetical protein
MAEWYTVTGDAAQDRLLAAWPDAPLANLEVLGMILSTAQVQVIAFAPADPEPVVVDGYIEPVAPTDQYVYAQLQQSVNLWNAGRVASDGSLGVEGYTFTPRPLDKTIRGIIRPTDGKPDVY